MTQLQHPEVVTFGESMALFTPENSKGIEYSSHFGKSFGGAESNFAIAVARLGCRSGWFGQLGKDPLGRTILKAIRGEGVDTSQAKLTTEAPTGFMMREQVAGQTSVYYYRKGSAASMMGPQHIDEAYIAGARMLHVTGITCAISESAKEAVYEAVRIARKHGVLVSFDPNLRLKLWSLEEAREALLPLAEQADYFLPGMDELKLLYNTEDEQDVIARLHKLKAVSVVKGAGDSTLLVEGGEVKAVPFVKVDHPLDPVGAGDGFCGGFIAGLLKGHDSLEAVKLGSLCGALVVQAEGDWEGLPTWEQVEAKLNNTAHIER